MGYNKFLDALYFTTTVLMVATPYSVRTTVVCVIALVVNLGTSMTTTVLPG